MYMRRMMLLVAGVLLLASCSEKKESGRVEPVKVKTLVAAASVTASERHYVGTVEESYGSSLSFSTMGTVKTVLVQEGQAVRQGQVLATLDDSQMRNALSIATATLRQAEDGYKRMKELYDKGSLPEVKFVDIQTKLSEAQTSVRMAKKNVDDCVLRAPFGGYISERSVDVGNNAMPGVSCFKLVRLGNVEVSFSVPEQEISSIRKGQSVAFTVAALGDRRFAGIVKQRGVQANPISHTYEVVVTVGNGDRQLLPGMVCSVETHQRGAAEGIVVPQEAVLTDGKRQFVWVAEGNKAKRKFVEVSDVLSQGVVITGGLGAGEQVIVEGQNKVSEGGVIKIEN